MRHVGLVESAHLIAAALGWKLDRVDETLEPAIAPRDLDTQELRIPAGAAAGIRQSVRAYRSGELAISLDLQVYVGAESPRDHILIDGDPSIDATIAGGINGETATAAVLLNSLPRLLAAPAGLLTVRDLPLVHALNPQDLALPVPAKALSVGAPGEGGTSGEIAEGVLPELLRDHVRRPAQRDAAARARRRGAEPALPRRPHRQRAHERRRGPARARCWCGGGC